MNRRWGEVTTMEAAMELVGGLLWAVAVVALAALLLAA